MGKTLLEHIENRKAELAGSERWFRQQGYEHSAGLALHALQELNDLTDAYFNVNTNDTDRWQATTNLRWKKKSNPHGYISHILQQWWVSDTGEEEWKDVPTEREVWE